MSVSIGIVFRHSNIDSQELIEWLESAAAVAKYRLSFGVAHAVREIQPGLEALCASWKTDIVALIHAPSREEEPLAGGIAVALEEGRADAFFQFLESVASGVSSRSALSVFFAVGRRANTRVRYGAGSVHSLVARLKSPCSWAEQLYDVPRASIWCDDEVPYLFTVNSSAD